MPGLIEQLRASALSAPDFAEVRRQRDIAQTLEAQRALALEDRRAFAREFVRERPLLGTLALLAAVPGEQVYKGLQHLRGRQVGRSGFFDPLANIGAGYTGIAEGLVTLGDAATR